MDVSRTYLAAGSERCAVEWAHRNGTNPLDQSFWPLVREDRARGHHLMEGDRVVALGCASARVMQQVRALIAKTAADIEIEQEVC